MMQPPINKIAAIVAIIATVSSFGLFAVEYHSKFATKEEVHLLNLDTRISVAELVVMGYQSKGLNKLNDVERGRYDRVNVRLINLESERDKIMGMGSD